MQLFFIRHKENGKFLCVPKKGEPYLSNRIIHAKGFRLWYNAAENFPSAEFDVYETTEEQFMQELSTLTAQAIIAGDVYRKLLEDVNYSLPTISALNCSLKDNIKLNINKLKSVTGMFKKIDQEASDELHSVMSSYEESIMLLSELGMEDFGEFKAVIRAFKKDRKSVLGITKKVLNN